ncbi:MAG: hypothetical protein ACRESZ_18625, partial [Methylococcales bacterium]
MNVSSWRVAMGLYLILFLALTIPYWANGEVVAPHRQFLELGAVDTSGAKELENRGFSDFTNTYIQEIRQHLEGIRSGWLKLWTDKNELGRPVYQIYGFSPAYFPSWIIALITDNPWRFITTLSLFNCLLAG